MLVLFDLLAEKTRDVEDHYSYYKRDTRKLLDQLLIQWQMDGWMNGFENVKSILDEHQVRFVDLDGIPVVNASGEIKHRKLRVQNIDHLVVKNQSQPTTNDLKFSG